MNNFIVDSREALFNVNLSKLSHLVTNAETQRAVDDSKITQFHFAADSKTWNAVAVDARAGGQQVPEADSKNANARGRWRRCTHDIAR